MRTVFIGQEERLFLAIYRIQQKAKDFGDFFRG